MKKLISNLKLIFSISRRFARTDKKSRSFVTSMLAVTGLCFGVMTLIVVMSVMNGFQMSFIDAIQEVSSYHAQVEKLESEDEEAFLDFCRKDKKIKSVIPFYQAESLMCRLSEKKSKSSVRESPAVIRALPDSVFSEDRGFSDQMILISGSLDLSERGAILLGSQLARKLNAGPGDQVNLFVLTGSSDVELFSSQRIFTVKGVFATGFQDINQTFAFINIDDALLYFGPKSQKIYGLKFNKSSDSGREIKKIRGIFNARVSSWKEYNKSFYGALRIEKNMLLLIVCLIFIVVAINIFNSMRRLVFERQRELAIFSAMGARPLFVKMIFIFRGFYTGLLGSLSGMLLGVLVSMNSDLVFNAAAKIIYALQYVWLFISDRESLIYLSENSSFILYASIPARIFPLEVFIIMLFGIISPLTASFMAGRNVMRLSVSEVLHDE